MNSVWLLTQSQGGYQIFLCMFSYQSGKLDSILTRTNQNRRQNNKNIELEY